MIDLIRTAKQRGAKVVLNQNGVAYHGWHGPGWEALNIPLRQMLFDADYAIYQSEFCKVSADRFLGSRQGNSEILYNPVDTDFYSPSSSDNSNSTNLTILLSGNQYQYYRLERALKTLSVVSQSIKNVRMLITGRLSWTSDEDQATRTAEEIARELGVVDKVEYLGPYTQQEAPDIYRMADILLHTKYNDPCPTVVIEAMATGLPVVYSSSGGTPELVGEDAGVGVASEQSWERDYPPEPQDLANAILEVAESRSAYSQAARQRAVDMFDVNPWVDRHFEIFQQLLDNTE